MDKIIFANHTNAPQAAFIVSFDSSKIGSAEVDIHRTLRIEPSRPGANPVKLVFPYVGFSKLSLNVAKVTIEPSAASGFSSLRIFQNCIGQSNKQPSICALHTTFGFNPHCIFTKFGFRIWKRIIDVEVLREH